MRFLGNGPRVAALALALAVTATTAGCAAGTPAATPASARSAATDARLADGAASTFPAVFAASFPLRPASAAGSPGARIALLSSRSGALLRWLTPRQDGVYDTVLSVHDGWVYFVRGVANGSIWRVSVAGGRAQLVQAGAIDYAVSADGRAAAYVVSGSRLDLAEIVVRNLVTGRPNTIVMATDPDRNANNWPPGISGLTWAPDDTHLAVHFYPTAAINSVLTFDAFTAATIRDGRTAPAPCPACGELDPAYLASRALTYVIQRISGRGTASASLVAWQPGRRTTLLSFPGGAPPTYDMTAQGQAIWAAAPPQPKGPWTIWRWSGGAPVKITTLPPLGQEPYYGVGGIAW